MSSLSMSSFLVLRRAADALPPSPTPEDLRAVGEIVGLLAMESAAIRARARVAMGDLAPRPTPGRAVTQLVRHHLRQHSNSVREQVRQAALAVIRREGPESVMSGSGASAPGQAHREEFDLREAAARLRRTVRELLAMLKWPQWRRALGWPRCLDGDRDWLFRASAIDNPESVTGAGHLEPPHHLPRWCVRPDDVADLNEFAEAL